jgi:peptide/nickel transport system permease protein
MIATILQRLVQMAFVMLGISILVFLIFFATPGSDPAARIEGRNAAPETVCKSGMRSVSTSRCRFNTCC